MRRSNKPMPGDAIQVPPGMGFGVATYPPGATFGPRQMHEFEFVWLIRGDAEYRVDGAMHAVPQGSIVLCQPATVDEFTWDRRRRTQHGYIHFQIAEKRLKLPPRASWPVVVLPAQGHLLEQLFRYALGLLRAGDRAMLTRTLDMMLHVFVGGQGSGGGIQIDVPPDPVARATEHLYRLLEDNPAAAVTLDDLAAVACVTAEHLCRLFQRSTGRSPMQTVRLARLDRAATLLTRTNFSISQVAELCGFASQFHFSRLFRRAFGGAPSDIRRNVRAGRIPPLPRLIAYDKPAEDQKQA